MPRAKRARPTAALARVGIAGLAGKQVATLSGGEMARVLLARAIVHSPDLLMLDEPFAGVDLAGEAALYRLIAELRDELGCGVLLVSHDLHVVMAEASRVICLNRHICCEGAAGAVIRDPAFVQLFGPRIAAELALYAHDHDHSHLPTGEVADGAAAEPHRHRRGPQPWMISCGARFWARRCWARRPARSAASCCGGAWPIWAKASPIWAFWVRGSAF